MIPADDHLRSTKLPANTSYPFRPCRFVGREDPIINDTIGPERIRVGNGGWTAN